MTNKRQQQKQQTRLKIFSTGKRLFLQRGFIDVTTAEIAKEAGVAHGTVFVHFPTREDLVLAVIDAELARAQERINKLLNDSSDFTTLASSYLDYLAENESFHALLSRELPFYKPELRNRIIFRQALIQMQFIDQLKDVNNAGGIVQFLFGMTHYYLSMRDAFRDEGGVIRRFKDSIMTTIRTMMGGTNK